MKSHRIAGPYRFDELNSELPQSLCQGSGCRPAHLGGLREIDRAAVLEDLDGGMRVMKVAAKHGIGRATVFRIKAEVEEARPLLRPL
ncbi:helix-turn-helix domain-containing protein [Streptomyces sp. NPDC056529]|uniref:helix-turn-helix domain-containing protein n=1 Tax=Streptomyces sp. NPDC056529 TaxID=3345855 RepID=UPI0036D055BC